MKLSLIVAMSRNGVIGKGGKLPWTKIKEDMKRFRELTMGKPCIMGRKTFQSLDKPLKGRRNIILSRSMNLTEDLYYGPNRICIVRTPCEAIHEAFDMHGTEEAFVIGGSKVYRIFGPLCDEAHVTTVTLCGDSGDTYFPFVFDGNDDWRIECDRVIAKNAVYRHYVRKACPTPTTNDTSAS